MGARFDFKVKAGPRSRLEKPKIAEFDALMAPLSFRVTLLSYAIALLGVKTLSDLLMVIKLYERIFCQVIILK